MIQAPLPHPRRRARGGTDEPTRYGNAVATPISERVTDPVSGMTVDPATSPYRADHGGREFHFYSAGCRTEFITDPQHYLAPFPPAAPPMDEAVASGTIYTWPMHPQIRARRPGHLPDLRHGPGVAAGRHRDRHQPGLANFR